MQLSAIPVKFGTVWGNAAGSSYIRTIPSASQIGVHDGWASLADGFPPLNFTPVASGGIPPFGQDHNGILRWMTQWLQWHEAGGPMRYDGAFATAIGGYPQGAILASTTNGYFWISTADNNTANPDTGGANWTRYEGFTRTWSALQTFSAGAYATGWDSGGASFRANGGGGNSLIIRADNSNGYLMISDTATGIYNSKRPISINFSTGAVSLGSNGESVSVGTGGLTIGSGAYGSGNTARAVRLGDFFQSYVSGGSGYRVYPDGDIEQVITSGVPFTTSNIDTLVTLPIAFPTTILWAMGCEGGYGGPGGGANPNVKTVFSAYSTSQVRVSTQASSGSGTVGVVIRAGGY